MNMNLKLARIRAELTQKELAKRVGITNKYLSQIERGVSVNPSKGIMERISKELKVPVQELFFET